MLSSSNAEAASWFKGDERANFVESCEMETAVPAPDTLQRLTKADGRQQFKRPTWTEIELPNYCLLKITQTR